LKLILNICWVTVKNSHPKSLPINRVQRPPQETRIHSLRVEPRVCDKAKLAGRADRIEPSPFYFILLLQDIDPSGDQSPGELFPRPGSLAVELFEQWLAKGVIRKRCNVNGHELRRSK
jgi:hypothetical protein